MVNRCVKLFLVLLLVAAFAIGVSFLPFSLSDKFKDVADKVTSHLRGLVNFGDTEDSKPHLDFSKRDTYTLGGLNVILDKVDDDPKEGYQKFVHKGEKDLPLKVEKFLNGDQELDGLEPALIEYCSGYFKKDSPHLLAVELLLHVKSESDNNEGNKPKEGEENKNTEEKPTGKTGGKGGKKNKKGGSKTPENTKMFFVPGENNKWVKLPEGTDLGWKLDQVYNSLTNNNNNGGTPPTQTNTGSTDQPTQGKDNEKSTEEEGDDEEEEEDEEEEGEEGDDEDETEETTGDGESLPTEPKTTKTSKSPKKPKTPKGEKGTPPKTPESSGPVGGNENSGPTLPQGTPQGPTNNENGHQNNPTGSTPLPGSTHTSGGPGSTTGDGNGHTQGGHPPGQPGTSGDGITNGDSSHGTSGTDSGNDNQGTTEQNNRQSQPGHNQNVLPAGNQQQPPDGGERPVRGPGRP